MARRRGSSGSTDWFGITGGRKLIEGQSSSEILAEVPGPATAGVGASGIQQLPSGTLLRTFGQIAVHNDTSLGGSTYQHPFAALHLDEAVLDEQGNQDYQPLDLTDQHNLGFEGLFWLGSCILWSIFDDSEGTGRGAAKRGCTIDVDSKAKRKLRSNDLLVLDLADLHPGSNLDFSWHFRFLIKYS